MPPPLIAPPAPGQLACGDPTIRPVGPACDHPRLASLGCQVDRCAYLATGVIVLHGARVGAGGSVAVGAVVPDEFFLPPNMVAVGDPVRVLAPEDPEALGEAVRSTGFARLAFGVDAAWEDRIARYERTAEVRSAEFAAHAGDTVLPVDGPRPPA